jgi:hypothetical protein
MEETMIAVRKSLLLGLAALALLTGLSGCIVAERPGHYREGPAWHQDHWNGGGGNWNNHYH